MKKTMIFKTIIVFLLGLGYAQAQLPTKPIPKADEAKIKELASQMTKLNQDMINNAAAAFDAIYSRLDGVKVDSKDMNGALFSFSLAKIRDRALGLLPFSEGVSLLKDLYNLKSDQDDKDIEIENAKTTNLMKELLAKVAERRTATFSINEEAIIAKMKERYKAEGAAYLTKMESGLASMNTDLLKMTGNVKTQTLVFQFEILQELINGMRKSVKSREFVVCGVRMTGCDQSGWETSLVNKTPNCPMIQRAKYEFVGGAKQQFTAAANAILQVFLASNDASTKLIMTDLDIDFHLRIHPPGCTEDCALMVPVSRRNRRLSINGNLYWNNCSGRDGMFLYALDNSNKLLPLVTPIVERIAKGNYVIFDYVFFEDVRVP